MSARARNKDRTLHLPRILCLHGGGTNAAIFQMQCRVIESKLSAHFRLVYADGPYETTATPDVQDVFGECAPFRSWFRLRKRDPVYEVKSVIENIDKVLKDTMSADDEQGATGEWVALLGFSQGARLAASMLYAQQTIPKASEDTPSANPHWRFAVIMAGPPPLAWLDAERPVPTGLVDAGVLPVFGDVMKIPEGYEEHLLTIPTIHVHGIHDPDVEWHRRLYKLYCRPETAILLEWDGSHRLPIKKEDVDAVVKSVILLAWKTGILESTGSEDSWQEY